VDLDRRIPDAQERLILDVLTFAETVQACPPIGVNERLRRLGAVRSIRIDAWQRRGSEHGPRRLDFSNQLLRLRIPPVVKVFDVDDV
jgi:hypothetical protein